MSEYAGEIPGLLVALAVGLIVGFERGWQNQNADDNRGRRESDGRADGLMAVTGIRTFALLGLLGGVAGKLVGFNLRMVRRGSCIRY